MPDGSRREWVKPIMFSGGVGQMAHEHRTKGKAEKVGRLVRTLLIYTQGSGVLEGGVGCAR